MLDDLLDGVGQSDRPHCGRGWRLVSFLVEKDESGCEELWVWAYLGEGTVNSAEE